MKTVTIDGVKFTPITVNWEDAYKAIKVDARQLLTAIMSGDTGPICHTHGWYAKIRGYLIICHEFCESTGNGDFTVIPLRPKVKIEKRDKRPLAKQTLTKRLRARVA